MTDQQNQDNVNGEVVRNDPDFNSKNDLQNNNSKQNGSESEDKEGLEDITYSVKIIVPGIDNIEIQVSSLELVQEIHQVLMDREDTCHKTCFSLQFNNQTLDNFAELKSIEGLQNGSEIKFVEESYNVREARNHVKHLHELLRSVDFTDAYLGRDQMSLSFLNVIANIADPKASPRKPENSETQPPDFLLPSYDSQTKQNLPISALHPLLKEGRPPQCLKQLSYSNWNPPPTNRRLHGDLLYLSVHTLEDKRFHITACPRGFYINESSDDEFNHHPAAHPFLSSTLVDLLKQISHSFKRGWESLLKRRGNKHPFDRVPGPYQVHSWLSPILEHGIDSIRKEEAFCSKMAYEENLPGQTREWNEELQATRELPQSKLNERLLRDRAIFKSNSDFVVAATRAAVSIVNGNIMAINPGETLKQRMFIWNNMFFSLGFDVKDHYKSFGGDEAAYAATVSDLNGVRAYSSLDINGLHTLGTVVVDYKGYRITAQTIIPGILEKEQEQSVIYGSIDFGKTVVSCDKYKDLLQKTTTPLKIRPHKVLNEKEEEVELFSSVECKGILGNDNRAYILDLLRTFPPDVNFLGDSIDPEELPKELRDMGFPYSHRHKLVTLRQELVEAFVETRYIIFLRLASIQIQQRKAKAADNENPDEKSTCDDTKLADVKNELNASLNNHSDQSNLVELPNNDNIKGTANEKEIEEAKKLVEGETKDDDLEDDVTKEIIRKACQAVGSQSDTHFSIAFNPDVYQEHVRFPKSEDDNIKKDKELVRDACEFLVMVQMPRFIQDCLEQTITPLDGQTLGEALHQRGINIRYLGKITEQLARYPSLHYLYDIAVTDLIVRAAKHLFNNYIQDVEAMFIASAVSHFLNCFLSSYPSPTISFDEIAKGTKKHKKKKGSKQKEHNDIMTQSWMSESPLSLWKKINEEIIEYFHYDIKCPNLESLVNIQRCTLLRSFCLSTGIQIALRDYVFDQKQRATFTNDDIINLFPLVKHLQPQATDAYNFFTTGQAKISQGLLQEGHELVSEALTLLNNVYGPLHPDIAACNRLLARLSYVLGDHNAAVMHQQRATIISERVHGVDSPHTTTEYGHLGLYCFASGQVVNALQLMYRARLVALICHGEVHPEMPVIDTNIGLMLHATEDFDKSILFLENALNLTKKFFGANSLKAAMSYHLLARAHSCRGDFRTAVQYEKECFAVYKEKLGNENERTRESHECLSHLTQQAVVFAKKMNELSRGENASAFSPIQIQTPTMANILETLNVVNGIFFIQLTGDDLLRLREEIANKSNSEANQRDSEQTVKIDSIEDASKVPNNDESSSEVVV